MKIVKRNAADISMLAIHEAGHAIHADKVNALVDVGINPDGTGFCHISQMGSPDLIVNCLAGPVATWLLGEPIDVSVQDCKTATQVYDRQARTLNIPPMKEFIRYTEKMLRERMQDLLRVASALDSKKHLTAADVRGIIEAGREFDASMAKFSQKN